MTVNRNYFFNSEKIHFTILPQATKELFQKYINSNIMAPANYLVSIYYVPGVIYNIYSIIYFLLYMKRKLRFREIK